MKIKHNFIYRFLVLLLAYTIFAVAVDLSLVQGFKDNPVAVWIMVGVTIGLFVVIEVANEIIIHIRKKKGEAKDNEGD
ncbi:MAG: hypothetical protein IJ247_04620 [Bacilli bacterium]|nr:hypothetical protein [Bacilli bacterium]